MKSSGARKYFANTTWMLLPHGARIAVSFVVTVWVIRYLGPGDYGLLSYAVSFVALFSALSMLGLGPIVTRDVVRNDNEHEVLLGTAFTLRLAGALLAVVAITGVLFLFPPDDGLTIALTSILALQFVLDAFGVITFYFHARVQARYPAISQLFQILVGSGLKASLILFRAPVIWFAAAILAEALALASGLVWAYHAKRSTIRRWQFSRPLARRLLSDALPVMLGGVAVAIYFKIDQVMIRHLLDTRAVGQYAAALRISEAWYFVPVVISTSLFPAIAEAQKSDHRNYETRLQRYHDLLTWVSIAIAAVLSLLAPTLVLWLYGRPYEASVEVVQIHVWAGVFVAMGSASGRSLLLENLQRYDLLRHVAGATMNIGLNMYFIPAHGIAGAAVSSVVSYGVAAYVFQCLHPRLFSTFRMQTRSLLLGWLELWRRTSDNSD